MAFELVGRPYKGRSYTVHVPSIGAYGVVEYSIVHGGWLARVNGEDALLEPDTGWARTFEGKCEAAAALIRAVEQ